MTACMATGTESTWRFTHRPTSIFVSFSSAFLKFVFIINIIVFDSHSVYYNIFYNECQEKTWYLWGKFYPLNRMCPITHKKIGGKLGVNYVRITAAERSVERGRLGPRFSSPSIILTLSDVILANTCNLLQIFLHLVGYKDT
jgi:hypothetical protein